MDILRLCNPNQRPSLARDVCDVCTTMTCSSHKTSCSCAGQLSSDYRILSQIFFILSSCSFTSYPFKTDHSWTVTAKDMITVNGKPKQTRCPEKEPNKITFPSDVHVALNKKEQVLVTGLVLLKYSWIPLRKIQSNTLLPHAKIMILLRPVLQILVSGADTTLRHFFAARVVYEGQKLKLYLAVGSFCSTCEND